MLRVRDELKMTLMAYQTLYESSIAFGIRKALRAEQGKAEMESYIQKLEAEKTKLDKEVKKILRTTLQLKFACCVFYDCKCLLF